jgi:homoserine kinase
VVTLAKVMVPATSANMGPGFDCMGIALELYNIVEANITDSGLQITTLGRDADLVENNENNLIYKAMVRLFDEVGFKPSGIKIECQNNIPVCRGLGSSASSIAAGLLLANHLSGNKLDIDQILKLGTEMEGHPDNIVPAIIGGMTISYMEDYSAVQYIRLGFPNALRMVLMVPDFVLATKQAREVLPRSVKLSDAAFNVSRAALMVAALLTDNLDHLRSASQDRLHQPYRARLIPGMKEVFDEAYKAGARGVFLSGAGSTLIAMIDRENWGFLDRIRGFLNKKSLNWELNYVSVSSKGAAYI